MKQDGTAEPVSRDQFSGANGDRKILIFPVQLTTGRVGNLTRLIHTHAVSYMSTHTFIHTLRAVYTAKSGNLFESHQ